MLDRRFDNQPMFTNGDREIAELLTFLMRNVLSIPTISPDLPTKPHHARGSSFVNRPIKMASACCAVFMAET